MYSSKPNQKLINENYLCIDIKDYVRTFLLNREKEGYALPPLRDLGAVLHLKQLLNCPEHTTYKSIKGLQTDFYYWDKQEVEYVSSNLGKGHGYHFYFLCNRCKHRVKHLYEFDMTESPLCRICCHLKYKAPSRKARELSRLIRKPYLSGEAKYMLIKRAGITRADIPDELENSNKR